MSASDRDRARQRHKPRFCLYQWDQWGPANRTVGNAYPCLLLDWRKVETPGRPHHWEGLVAYASGGGDQDWSLVTKWVRSIYLTPIGDEPTA